ncbi:MAG TPA: SDR family oxidoreductase, partial [Thermoanaerobaculia bacterium]|nr:SDR family oxidoreductase [Thermoanaerobaculia bacterium]
VATAMTEALSVEAREALSKQIVLGRLGAPDDVADAVLYLASDMGAYVTGTCLNVSGGLYIG